MPSRRPVSCTVKPYIHVWTSTSRCSSLRLRSRAWTSMAAGERVRTPPHVTRRGVRLLLSGTVRRRCGPRCPPLLSRGWIAADDDGAEGVVCDHAGEEAGGTRRGPRPGTVPSRCAGDSQRRACTRPGTGDSMPKTVAAQIRVSGAGCLDVCGTESEACVPKARAGQLRSSSSGTSVPRKSRRAASFRSSSTPTSVTSGMPSPAKWVLGWSTLNQAAPASSCQITVRSGA